MNKYLAITLAAVFTVATDASAARRVGKLLMPSDAVCRVAMFVIPVNADEDDAFTGFELRESSGKFCAQSEIASEAWGVRDTMRLYVCTSASGGDGRKYTRIADTISWTNRLASVVALVDASNLARHPGGDWLRSDNAALSWCYLRNRPVDPASEIEYGTDAGQYRPVAPVWLKDLPAWAK